MRRVLALGVTLGAIGGAVWACDSDSFNSDASVDADAPDALAAFCSAESQYAYNCGQAESGCAQQNIAQCSTTFASLNPAFAAAYATCVDKLQLPCNANAASTFTDGGCLQQQLAGFVNDSGALAMLANDFCAKCANSVTGCAQVFASNASEPGYLASLLSDQSIKTIDSLCAQKEDGGTTANTDAAVCAQKFVICELTVAAATSPTDYCADAGASTD